MKHWMRFALWLYPTEYAREFEALLEDVRPGSTPRNGLKMRLLRWSLANVTMACALIGAAVGGGWAPRIPDQYISSAVPRWPS